MPRSTVTPSQLWRIRRDLPFTRVDLGDCLRIAVFAALAVSETGRQSDFIVLIATYN
jgi:hypothetical protein